MAKKSKDPLKSLNKLLERAKNAESGVASLARRAEMSAMALAGAVRQLENLVARQLGSPAATPAAPKRKTTRRRKTSTKRTTSKRTAAKRAPKAE